MPDIYEYISQPKHTSLHAWDEVCAQKGQSFSPDSIDTLISQIRLNLAEIWARARKHIGCMHASLRAWVDLCAQKDWVCSSASIDTLISPI